MRISLYLLENIIIFYNYVVGQCTIHVTHWLDLYRIINIVINWYAQIKSYTFVIILYLDTFFNIKISNIEENFSPDNILNHNLYGYI